MQVQQEDTEKQKVFDIPSPEMIDFKVKAAELKTFTKVNTTTITILSYITKKSH